MNKQERIKRLTRLANRFSDKGIYFREGPPCTDGENIYIPVSEHDYNDLVGLTAHESFHIRAHTFAECLNNISNVLAVKYKINSQSAHGIANVSEDFRIEQWIAKIYPGANRKLQEFSEKFVREHQFKEPELPLVHQLSLALNQFDETFMEDLKSLKSMKLEESDYEEIEKLKEKMIKNISPEYGVIAANELAKIYVKIRERLIKEEPQKEQEQQKGQGSQEGQQEQQEQQEQQKGQNGQQNDQNSVPDDMENFENDFDEDFDMDDLMDNSQNGKGNEQGPSNGKVPDSIKEIQDFEQKEQKNVQDQTQKGNSMENPNQQANGQSSSSLSKEEQKKSQKVQRMIQEINLDHEIDEKKLEKAQEEAMEEINKILDHDEQQEQKEVLKNEEGQTCERIKDRQQLEKGAKMTYPRAEDVIRKNRGLIRQITQILGLKSEKVFVTRGHKTGRLNRDIVRTVASDYTNTNCFSRVEIKSKGKMMFVLDLSGSMSGQNIEMLKEAIITIAKALENSANIRIVGYTSNYTFVFKEFDEPTDLKKLDLIGLRKEGGSTPTGISLETEFTFMERTVSDALGRIPIVLITDGQPDSQKATKKAISRIRKNAKIFAIGLHYQAYDWDELFGPNNWVTINDERELKLKLLNISRKIVKQF